MATDTTSLPRTSPDPSAGPGPARPAERETAALDPALTSQLDAFSILDHRSRRRAVPVRQAQLGHHIALENGDNDSFLIPLDDKLTHIGRAIAADLRFEDPHVSRRHAIIVRYGRHVRVLDDRSSAGTFVNGRRIIATTLEDGDVVRIGPVSFTYTIVR